MRLISLQILIILVQLFMHGDHIFLVYIQALNAQVLSRRII